MIRLIVKRLAVSIVTLWVVTIMVFAGTELLPGDVAEAILGQSATPETVAGLRGQLGLDRPAQVRYLTWLRGFVSGDLGVSLASGVPITKLIKERLGNTLFLAAVTAVMAVPIAILLGLLAAMFPGSLFDRAVSVLTLCLVAIPEFLSGSILVLIFAVYLGWLPAIAYITEFRSVGQLLSSLAMPILTLSFSITAQMARMTRATVLNIMDSSYIEMALLKGVSRGRIIFRHSIINVIGPIANVVALNLTFLVGGVVIVETIFAFPGLAKLIVDAVSTRDFPVVQSCAMVFCAAYILFMLIADIVAIVSNPKLWHPR
ncbi:MAG: ABC transporter permease [Thermodesulfobacteriota bacterium]